MNSEAIIFLAIVILSAIPIIIINSKKRKKEKLFIQVLLDLAEKSNCKITERDLWNNTQIGIDKDAGKLFLSKRQMTKRSRKLLICQKYRNAG